MLIPGKSQLANPGARSRLSLNLDWEDPQSPYRDNTPGNFKQAHSLVTTWPLGFTTAPHPKVHAPHFI